MQIKYTICMYCGVLEEIPPKARLDNHKCKACHIIWHRLRTRYKNYGSGVDVHCLVRWWVSSKKVCVECGAIENLTVDRIIPGKSGGLYHPNNLQILCYTCNCCKKLDSRSVQESINQPPFKMCKICKKQYPLTKEYFHKLSFRAKYRKNSVSEFHYSCRLCRLKLLREMYVPKSSRKRSPRVTGF